RKTILSAARKCLDYLWRFINAGLLNYSVSGQSSHAKGGSGTSTESQFVSLQPGLNILGWAFRNYSTFNHDEDGGKWESIYSYVSRDIGILKSQLVLGNTNTSSKVFDSMSFTGVQLRSDEEMLPDSMHGYAPIIRGIARTTAEVTVYQNKYSIYKTTVPPGAFEISDLYPTGSAGDLYVEVKESDGSKQNFIVPYASLAVLQREGQLQYAFSGGKTRTDNSGTHEFNFVQSSLTYGLTSDTSVYGGFQLAENSYSNLLLGAGFNMGGIGAVSVDVSQSSANVKQETGSEKLSNSQGQSYRMRFSKSFPQSGTNFSVAGYRYSTHGYYSFQDYIDNVSDVSSSDYTKMSRERTRNRFDISASQILASYGSLSLSLISESYWDDARMESLSLGYSNNIGRASYFINYSYNRNVSNNADIGSGTSSDSVISFTISLPLGEDMSSNYSVSDSRTGHANHSIGIDGTALADRTLNWSVQEGYDSNNKSTSGNLNLSYQNSKTEMSGGYGYDSYSNRYNYALRGGMMLHSGGLTLSRPLGESVALVETPGVSDASVVGQTDIKTDSNGYAVIPYVRAYHENSFALDDNSLSNVDVDNISKTVVPVRNSVVKIHYATHIGYKSMVVLTFNGKTVPFGAIATLNNGDDDKPETNGSIVGDAGNVYLSGMPNKGEYIVKWGAGINEMCRFNYDFSSRELSDDIILYQANCH
uniref:fimbria/pilus outer membrane usher protein n=1 Tax=Kluyvera sp. CHPC 1.251 TaxID=2995175 RepID=UPI002FD842A3